jgi:hypothetical protein
MGASPLPPAEHDQALLVLALNGGNSEAAHRELQNHGIKISSRALRNYRETPRYAEIYGQNIDLLRKHSIARFQEGAMLSLQLARAAALQALSEAERGELKDAAKTLQNATIAAGVATDKALILNGEPNVIHAHEDPRQAAQSLARRLGVALATTGTTIHAESETLPLVPGSADANARDSSVSSSSITPSD